jgi:hypothetical protein
MTTGLVVGGLLVLAVLDGAFSGFRASAGRTGMIGHRAADWRAARRGVALACLLLLPATAVVSASVLTAPRLLGADTRTGVAMLAVYAPYALVVLLALACYSSLSWRKRYLAMTVILGPLTLLRPVVAIAGAAAGAVSGGDVLTSACAIAAAAALLAVEPAAGRAWYAPRASHVPQV